MNFCFLNWHWALQKGRIRHLGPTRHNPTDLRSILGLSKILQLKHAA